MAFGTQSAIFRAFLADALAATASFTPQLQTGGTWKAALYSDLGTPDNNATSALSAYNAATSAWVTANEKTDTNWPAGGRPLVYSGGSGATGTRWNVSTANLVFVDADDTAGAGNVTLSGVMGDLVYNDGLTTPVAKQALGYHSFGGAQGVTGGTFTIVWHANGVARWTQAPA